jgi:hypothetical protein
MAQLYGDLDYWHPFVEGNSRTLRTFTRQWARQASFVLDWGLSKPTEAPRDRLYIARDREVLTRAFPDLTEERAMLTDDPVEYEVYHAPPFPPVCLIGNADSGMDDDGSRPWSEASEDIGARARLRRCYDSRE